MTEELFREDSYLKSCEAEVTAIIDGQIILDKTVFYPLGGGQPGDTGRIERSNGSVCEVVDTRKSEGGIAHIPSEDAELPDVGETVTAHIDWNRRYRFMRMHTCMHVLSSLIPFGVTGGSIRDGSARLDFDAPEPMDKEAINTELNEVISRDAPVSKRWITDEELDAQPDLVKTLSVQPPRGTGKVRLIEIEGVDLQPCGGTHLNSIAEIGKVRIKKIEKKGKHNRRVIVEFDEQ